jgi:hypothetical protein
MAKSFVYNLFYDAFCFLIRHYRIARHTIQLKMTSDIIYLYEIEHYREMKIFSSIGKLKYLHGKLKTKHK